MPDLKCTITITGKQGEESASVEFDFNPAVTPNGPYDNSGVMSIANLILRAIENGASMEERKVTAGSGVEMEF